MAKRKIVLPPLGGKWRVQDVTPRQTKVCEQCGKRPAKKRVVWLEDGHVFPKPHTFCVACSVVRARKTLRVFKHAIIAFADHYGVSHGYKIPTVSLGSKKSR